MTSQRGLGSKTKSIPLTRSQYITRCWWERQGMVLFLKTDPGYTQKQIITSRLLLLFIFTRLSVSYCTVLCEGVKSFHIQGGRKAVSVLLGVLISS